MSEALSPDLSEFLSNTLGLADYEVLPLAGDASSRRYYRIVLDQESWVLMAWEPFVDDGEYPFLNVQAHFAKHGVRVPKVVARGPEAGMLLLEDLGDLTLERKFWENQNQSLSIPYYTQAIDEILKVHYDCSLDRNSNCVAFRNFFNVDKLMWELNYGLDHLFLRLCGLQLSDKVRQSLNLEFQDICMLLDAEDKYICHRDYHSRNIMLKLGKAYLIDFQDARMGPIQYDLVSLLHDSYVNLETSHRESLLQHYLEGAEQKTGQAIHRDRFQHIYMIQILQRCFKACGSFSSFYNMREDTRYLKYIGPTINTVYHTLQNFSAYKTFKSIIEDNDLLNCNYEDPTHIEKG